MGKLTVWGYDECGHWTNCHTCSPDEVWEIVESYRDKGFTDYEYNHEESEGYTAEEVNIIRLEFGG